MSKHRIPKYTLALICSLTVSYLVAFLILEYDGTLLSFKNCYQQNPGQYNLLFDIQTISLYFCTA